MHRFSRREEAASCSTCLLLFKVGGLGVLLQKNFLLVLGSEKKLGPVAEELRDSRGQGVNLADLLLSVRRYRLICTFPSQAIGLLAEVPAPERVVPSKLGLKLVFVKMGLDPVQLPAGALVPLWLPHWGVIGCDLFGGSLFTGHARVRGDVKEPLTKLEGLSNYMDLPVQDRGRSGKDMTVAMMPTPWEVRRPSTTAQPTARRRGSEEWRPPLASVPTKRSSGRGPVGHSPSRTSSVERSGIWTRRAGTNPRSHRQGSG